MYPNLFIDFVCGDELVDYVAILRFSGATIRDRATFVCFFTY